MQIGKADAPVSHIAQAYPDRVEVRGRDLTGDLMGRLSFTEYFHLLLTGRQPTSEQRYFLDLLLVAIAEHGMMPTNVAARMTLAADPASLKGPSLPGSSARARWSSGPPTNARACSRPARSELRRVSTEQVAEELVDAIRASGERVPGFGHPYTGPSIREPSASLSWLMPAARAGTTCSSRAVCAMRFRRSGRSRSDEHVALRAPRSCSISGSPPTR